jgi:hypothetical protein
MVAMTLSAELARKSAISAKEFDEMMRFTTGTMPCICNNYLYLWYDDRFTTRMKKGGIRMGKFCFCYHVSSIPLFFPLKSLSVRDTNFGFRSSGERLYRKSLRIFVRENLEIHSYLCQDTTKNMSQHFSLVKNTKK